MDFQQQSTLYDFGDEDDIFYCELREQVLQLTAEDEEEEEVRGIKAVAEQKQRFNVVPRGGTYYDWAGNKEDLGAPVWMHNLWRPGNGTGVFIPQVVAVQTKKKNRSRRKRNERGLRTHMRVEKI